MFKIVAFIISTSVLLTGCVSTSAVKLTEEQAMHFFENQSAKGFADIYFICGEWRARLFLDKSDKPMNYCTFTINGNEYNEIYKDDVGKLSLPYGRYEIQFDDLGFLPLPLDVEINDGNPKLVITHLTHKQTLLTSEMVTTVEIKELKDVNVIMGKNPVEFKVAKD